MNGSSAHSRGTSQCKGPRHKCAWYAGDQMASGDGTVSGERPGTGQHRELLSGALDYNSE